MEQNTVVREVPDHRLAIDGGHVIIQSCDDALANIGVFVSERSAYHHVTLPDLTRQWQPVHANELPVAVFDAALRGNQAAILERISFLNQRRD